MLQINKLVFLFISFMKGLCSPRVMTLFMALFIFVVYFHDYCFISRCYLLPITVLFVLLLFIISLFVLFQSVLLLEVGCLIWLLHEVTLFICIPLSEEALGEILLFFLAALSFYQFGI